MFAGSVMFGKRDADVYVLKPEVAEAAEMAIVQAIKSELPEEARRVDVIRYLLDGTKEQIEAKSLIL